MSLDSGHLYPASSTGLRGCLPLMLIKSMRTWYTHLVLHLTLTGIEESKLMMILTQEPPHLLVHKYVHTRGVANEFRPTSSWPNHSPVDFQQFTHRAICTPTHLPSTYGYFHRCTLNKGRNDGYKSTQPGISLSTWDATNRKLPEAALPRIITQRRSIDFRAYSPDIGSSAWDPCRQLDLDNSQRFARFPLPTRHNASCMTRSYRRSPNEVQAPCSPLPRHRTRDTRSHRPLQPRLPGTPRAVPSPSPLPYPLA